MTNLASYFDQDIKKTQSVLKHALESGTPAEAISAVVMDYYTTNLNSLVKAVTGDESKTAKLLDAVKEEADRYSCAELAGENTTRIFHHITGMLNDISGALQGVEPTSGITSLEGEIFLLLVPVTLKVFGINDDVSEAHETIIDYFQDGLDAIDDAGKLDRNKEMHAYVKLSSTYSEAVGLLTENKLARAKNLMNAIVEELQDELDF